MPLSKAKKSEYFNKMTGFLETYTKVFVVQVDNVGSQQMNATRKQMRGTAEILMGKNTLMRKVLKEFLEKNPNHFHASLDAKVDKAVLLASLFPLSTLLTILTLFSFCFGFFFIYCRWRVTLDLFLRILIYRKLEI